MVDLLEGVVPYNPADTKKYIESGWWRGVTLGELLDRAADIHPDKIGFADRSFRSTYGEARLKSEKLAIQLLNIGIKPTERILLQLPNWIEFTYAYFACQKIGAIPVLLIDRYRQLEINQLAKITGATGWIVPTQYKKTDFRPIVDDVLRDTPQIRNVITARGEIDREGFHSLDQLINTAELSEANKRQLKESRPDPGQVAHMGPTGGTTGAPKIVPRTHNSLFCGVEHCSLSWEQHCEDKTLIAGPIGHDLSFTKGFLGSVIMMASIFYLDSTDNDDICHIIESEKITSIVWVPTLAQRLLSFDKLGDYDLSSLKKMHSGGGASLPDLIKGVMEKLQMRFHNGYGGTEGMTTITRAVDDYKTICDTVGRPTFPHDIYKVVDFMGRDLAPGNSGELLVKGPCVFSGYFNNPDENKKTFTEDGFFRTGDIAKIDERGYITLTGRMKEMINRGGESISATVIERLIDQHSDVAVVAVVPMPDPVMGEKACAYIEPVAGKTLTFEIIIDFLKGLKASVLELPERIEFVEEMFYTKAQKLDKKAIREDIENKLRSEGVIS
jgi:non-ribosomal peptide synthetase component E (peptide arylation enzyme)